MPFSSVDIGKHNHFMHSPAIENTRLVNANNANRIVNYKVCTVPRVTVLIYSIKSCHRTNYCATTLRITVYFKPYYTYRQENTPVFVHNEVLQARMSQRFMCFVKMGHVHSHVTGAGLE